MPKKLRALIADDEESIAEVLAIILEHELGAEARTVHSGKDAIEALREGEYDLVLCDYNMPSGNGGEVFAFVSSMAKQPHFVLVTSDHLRDHPEFAAGKLGGYVQKPFGGPQLVEAVRALFPAPSAETALGAEPEGLFCRIRPLLLHMLNVLPCDLFIQLSTEKFVKVMNEGDVFSNGDLDRFRAKGVGFLFVQKNNIRPVLAKLVQRLSSLAQAELVKGQQPSAFELSEAMQLAVHDLAAGIGFSAALEEAVKANLSLACAVIERNPDLFRALKGGVMLDPKSYASSHSVLLPYISCGMAEMMDWSSEHTFQKLTLASFLHDCHLVDPGLARVESEKELEEKKFSAQDQKKWREHTEKAAEIARAFSEIPADVDQIVGQHHEMPDGSGFPNGLHHTRIAPLSALFIVAHEFLRFYERTGSANLVEFAKQNKEKFGQGQFKRIMAVIGRPKAEKPAA